jgi:hypothetical protein
LRLFQEAIKPKIVKNKSGMVINIGIRCMRPNKFKQNVISTADPQINSVIRFFMFPLVTKIYKNRLIAMEPAKLLAAQETPEFHQEGSPLVIHLL